MKDRNKGIIFILFAALFFATMNMFVKLAGDVPVLQKCFFRNAVAMIVSGITVIRIQFFSNDESQRIKVKRTDLKYLFARAAAGTMGLICNFYSIEYLNISDASMLNKLSPFFAIILSIFILKEIPTKVDWIAVIIAFMGALFVVKPSFSMDTVPALIGVIGGLGAGTAYTCVRKLGQNGVKGQIIVLFFSTFSCLVTLPFVTINYSPMSFKQFMMLMAAGMAATGGQFTITAAYSKAPAKELSVFDYSQVIFAAMLGFFFLDQIPDIWSVIGYVIIIGVAFAKWYYNLKKIPEID